MRMRSGCFDRGTVPVLLWVVRSTEEFELRMCYGLTRRKRRVGSWVLGLGSLGFGFWVGA
jgi:hypothetical protein